MGVGRFYSVIALCAAFIAAGCLNAEVSWQKLATNGSESSSGSGRKKFFDWTLSDDFQFTTPYPSQGVAIAHNNTGALFALGSGLNGASRSYSVIRRSTDSGATWSTVDSYSHLSGTKDTMGVAISADTTVNIVDVVLNFIYSAGVRKILFRHSTDGGNTFSNMTEFFQFTNQDTVANGFLARSSTNYQIVGSGNDGTSHHWYVWKSVTAGASFSSFDDFYLVTGQAAGANGISGYHDGSNEFIFVAGYAKDSGSAEHWIVRRSIDGAGYTTVDDYSRSPTYDSAATTVGVDYDLGIVYVGGYGNDGGGTHAIIRRSLDDGASWTTGSFQYEPGYTSKVVKITGPGGGEMVALVEGRDSANVPHWLIYHTMDSGSNWNIIDNFVYPLGSGAIPFDITGLNNVAFTIGLGFAQPGQTEPHWVVRKSGF